MDTVVEPDHGAPPPKVPPIHAAEHGHGVSVYRTFALASVAIGLTFVFSNYLNFWQGWPGVPALFADLGWFGLEAPSQPFDGAATTRGWSQLALYLAPVVAITAYVLNTPMRSLQTDSDMLSAFVVYLIRAGFWAVLLIGLADMVISFLRVEGLLKQIVSDGLADKLGRTAFRGVYVHYVLVGVALVIAMFNRSLGFTWLALLIVGAEITIVIARFVFSYEQAFMSDLVRFWYGALFLFASPYTLIQEGHVRVDIAYAGFSERGKAWTNSLGSVFLGLPLCWVIMTRGMWGKSNIISGPLLNYEVTQSGYGLYVKYLLAGFLLVFAVTMLIQFMSYFLSSVAILMHEPGEHHAAADQHPAVI